MDVIIIANSTIICPNGGSGRHERLKLSYPFGCAGSNPV